MVKFPKKLRQKLEDRAAKNAFRGLSHTRELIDFSSNDYLGFAKNKDLFEQTIALLTKKGIAQNGATGSRLLSGNHQLYTELEQKIANCHASESALVFNSGYDANLGFFGSVPQRNDIVFYDEHVHASIRDGLKLGNAKNRKFKHNDLDDLKSKIELSVRAQSRTFDTNVYIITESVFSMDGDSPDLKAFANFSNDHDYHLVVDEAHALGVFGTNGNGLVQGLGLEQMIFARIVTFGKAFGCHGAAILGDKNLTSYLVNFARSFVYTTGLPPHSVATILAAYKLAATPVGFANKEQLQKNIEYFRQELSNLDLDRFFISSRSAIHCCLVPGNDRVKSIAHQLQKCGFDVRPILSPTVPMGQERLRFCLHSYNSSEEISEVLGHLSKLITLE